MKRRIIVVAAVTIFVMLFAEAALAQKVTTNGRAFFVPVQTESYELPDGRTVENNTYTGFSINNDDPSLPGNETCIGTRLVAADGKSWVESGYCYTVDPDGDVVWLWFNNRDGAGEWHHIGGTGQYEGITGGGTSKRGTEWADGKWEDVWKGSWEIPE